MFQVPGYEGIIECPPEGVLCQPPVPWAEPEESSSDSSSESSESAETEPLDDMTLTAEPEDGNDNEIDGRLKTAQHHIFLFVCQWLTYVSWAG